MEETIAGQIYLSGEQKDTRLTILEILALTKKADIEKVFEIYKKIQKHETLVARIITSVTLEKTQKSSLEKFVAKQFSDKGVIFVYEENKNVKNGIEVNVDDNKIDFTLS